MTDRPDHAREIKAALTDPERVLSSLGLLTNRRSFVRQARGFLVCCPVHNEKTPSCSVQYVKGQLMWKCHSCDASGDALSLVAAVHGLSTKSDFRAVLRAGAELAGLWSVVEELDSGRVQEARPVVAPPAHEPEPERDYPPADDVAALWAMCKPVTSDPDVAGWLTDRGVDPEAVEVRDLARAMPMPFSRAWAAYRRVSWFETGHRLILPMRDVLGAIVTVRAGRVRDGESPKRLPPGGYKASGVVLADERGAAMLAGTWRPKSLAIVEGEPDFLTRASETNDLDTAVIGIVSGSWTPAFAARVPVGCTVAVRTHNDPAGDRYAAEIGRTLKPRGCFVRRWVHRGA
jgi:hypothetical protein